ncbi:MAG: MMPL family transporter [Thermodesulfobacteriota bacterium]|nr:MMPL family transporter [Thermodesulfobacteriota bacterium]
MKKTPSFYFPTIILVAAAVSALFCIGFYRLKIDTDIIKTLPESDPVISDAGYILMNHPARDQLVIDLFCESQDSDVLVEAGQFIEKKLMASGLFKSTGMKEIQNMVPELIFYILKNLPVLFTEGDLNNKVKPLLEPGQVASKLEENYSRLLHLDGIGQSELMAADPVGLRNIILAELLHLFPSQKAKVYRGQLLSSDGRHLLLTARPITSGTDTDFAREATKLIKKISLMLDEKYSGQENQFTLTPVGAYRAALDNEMLAKRDIKKAIIFSMIGIAVLLIIAFPRPYVGLLSFLPAVAGTMVAFFLFSLFNKSISALTIGFGGAIISITVDHGIAYLLFLDRHHQTSGRDASKEVWAVGLLSTLTTVGAFLVLCISGFPILAQVGQFAAFGIACSFLFVHTIFPLIFPSMPAAKKNRTLPLMHVVKKVALSGGKYKAWGALVFAMVMVWFAKPVFQADLRSMNTISKETKAAEHLVTRVWGDVFSKIFLLTEEANVSRLQQKGDTLLKMLEHDKISGVLDAAFVPSMIFPGEERARENFSAWTRFWDSKRVKELKGAVEKVSADLGFAPNAFDPFYETIYQPDPHYGGIPKKFYSILGILENKNPDGPKWIQLLTLTPGSAYQAEAFYTKYASGPTVKLFDPKFFSKRLGELLSFTFIKMVLIIGLSVALLCLFFFFDVILALVALAPVVFAFVCTLGTLKLLGHPLDIPGLMLSIVVMGMGIDYSLFFVRSYQRYLDEHHPSLGIIRMAVFLASASTLIGFGVLNTADHSMLKGAGLTSFTGIAYCLIGTFAILPPVLKYLFAQKQLPAETVKPGSKKHLYRILKQYRHREALVRLFVRYKLAFDPMFTELFNFIESPQKIIELNSGYGLGAVCLLEIYPKAKVYGIEPDSQKARIASIVTGQRGFIKCAKTPELPQPTDPVDCAVMIDTIQHLTDDELKLTLKRLNLQLCPGGSLLIRAAFPNQKAVFPILWCENIWRKIMGIKPLYRSEDEIKQVLVRSGFEIQAVAPSAAGGKGQWFFARLRNIQHHADKTAIT